MPSVFNKLTTVIIWILFVTGCLAILSSFTFPFIDYRGNWQGSVVGVISLFLAVVTIEIKRRWNSELEFPVRSFLV